MLQFIAFKYLMSSVYYGLHRLDRMMMISDNSELFLGNELSIDQKKS